MLVHIESRRTSPATLAKRHPGAGVVDVTSKGPEPWVRFSPFFPHGGIPIPGRADAAQSVEGLWQGLKVFEREGTDPRKWALTTMSGIKRGGASRGPVRGHQFGTELLDYRAARFRIYLPAYRWVLENRLSCEVAALRQLAGAGPLVLLDYETNADPNDLSAPLSHAALVRAFLEGAWPAA